MPLRRRRFDLALAALLSLLVCAGRPGPASGAPTSPDLTAGQRDRLVRSASDPTLDPWQRKLMLELAGVERVPIPPEASEHPLGWSGSKGSRPAASTATSAISGSWSQLSVPGSSGPLRLTDTAIYDPVRDRLVVFGGSDGVLHNDTWVLSLSGAPTWSLLATSGAPPSPRREHRAIYDPLRDRMIVFGGAPAGPFANDTWELSFAGTPTWNQLQPSGPAPSPRAGMAMVYDPPRDRMLVFDGYDGVAAPAGRPNDVWALNLSGPPAWTQLAPTGTAPSARSSHSAIYDPVRDRVVVFGGTDPAYQNDVWALALAGTPAWSPVATAGSSPAARESHGAVYDPGGDRLVIFGGLDASFYYGDVWELSLSGTPTWSQHLLPGPGPRWGHGYAYDPKHQQMLVHGGYGFGIGIGYQGDAWALSLSGPMSWTRLSPPAEGPYRLTHSAVYDGSRNRMVVFGGSDGVLHNDTWVLSLSGAPTWSLLATSGTPPSPRREHRAIYDPLRDRMIVFGGLPAGPFANDTWELSFAGTPTWNQLQPSGPLPSGRAGMAMVYDPPRDRMLVFDGYDGVAAPAGRPNDVWALNLSGPPAWTQLAPTGTAPSARSSHSAIYDPVRDRVVVFGGTDPAYQNDVWALTLAGTPAWSALVPIGAPPAPRESQVAIYDPVRDRMVMHGGLDASFYYGDVWELALAGAGTWSQLFPTGPPPDPRWGHTAIYEPLHDRMVIYGGRIPGYYADDAWALTWDRPVPAEISLVSAQAENNRVRIVWQAADAAGLIATVTRAEGADGWSEVGRVSPDGTGRMVFEDRNVVAGQRYGYRLGLQEGGAETFAGEAWVWVPGASTLGLGAPRPNPVSGRASLAIALGSDDPARLEVVDIAGRVVIARDVGSLGAGRHTITLDGADALHPGLYLVRLSQRGRAVTGKMVVAR